MDCCFIAWGVFEGILPFSPSSCIFLSWVIGVPMTGLIIVVIRVDLSQVPRMTYVARRNSGHDAVLKVTGSPLSQLQSWTHETASEIWHSA